jgi:two-component system, NarL family, response regulator NreC
MGRIRVLIADDHAVLRAGLRVLIAAQADMEVVAEAADGDEALKKSQETRPDVALLDITMPGRGGIQAIERIRQACPATRVLVLTMHDVPAYLRSALAAGATGYVVKRAADSELISAIRGVHRGRTILDPSLAVMVVQGAIGKKVSGGQPVGSATLLSPREREVLDLVAQGYTNQQIADRLGLSIKTVETYRSRLVEKLGLRSRADLVRYAVDSGLFGSGQAPPDPRQTPSTPPA